MTRKRLCVKIIEWLLWNSLLVGFAIAGVAYQIEGAANVFRMLAWISSAPAILLLMIDEETQARLGKTERPFPPYIGFWVDVALACFLCYHTWFGYGALILIAGSLTYATYDEIELKRASEDKRKSEETPANPRPYFSNDEGE